MNNTNYVECPDCRGMFTCYRCEEHKALEALNRFDERHETQAQRDANTNYEDERSALVDALAIADGTAERCENCDEVTEIRELLERDGLCFGCALAEHSRC